jgi:hypothetical protein
VKIEIAEIKKEVELKEIVTFEKDIQCDLIQNIKLKHRSTDKENMLKDSGSEEDSSLFLRKEKRTNYVGQFSDLIPQITHKNRETLVLKLIEFHIDQIEYVSSKMEQNQLSTNRKNL